jgi:uncharacterized protein YkwD
VREVDYLSILPAMPRRPLKRPAAPRAGRRRSSRLALAALALLSIAALTVVPAATASTSGARHRGRLRRARTAAACPNANAAVGRAPVQALRTAVVCLINQQRTSRHLPPLRASRLLDRSAQKWTNAMVASDVFSHGTNFAARITAVGYVWRAAGENIATGFQTPRSVVNAWMASTGHCQNILNPQYRNVGTGVSVRTVRGWATGAGTWTQDFALGMHSSPPSGNYSPMDACPY